MYRIIDINKIQELKNYDFEYDEDIDEYVREVKSLTTKGMFVDKVCTGYLFCNKNGELYDYISNKYWNVEKEHKESLDKIYEELIKNNIIEKGENNE